MLPGMAPASSDAGTTTPSNVNAVPTPGSEAAGSDLAAYAAEIKTTEDSAFEQVGDGDRTIGASFWSSNPALLKEIDQRHGIQPGDVRVYSITAYREEIARIEEDWKRLRLEQGWNGIKQDDPRGPESWRAFIRFNARVADCRARHFPGYHKLGMKTIDTRPKLWIAITTLMVAVRETIQSINGVDIAKRPTRCPEDVAKVYGVMQRLKIPWTPPPPYPSFTEEEADHELMRIANQLEQEDAEEYERCVSRGVPVGLKPADNKTGMQVLAAPQRQCANSWPVRSAIDLAWVHHYAVSLREAFRPCLTAYYQRDQNFNAWMLVQLLEGQLNPNCLPPGQVFSGLGRTLADLYDVCHALFGLWRITESWKRTPVSVPPPLTLSAPPAQAVETLTDTIERLESDMRKARIPQLGVTDVFDMLLKFGETYDHDKGFEFLEQEDFGKRDAAVAQRATQLGLALPTPEHTTKGLTEPTQTRGQTCLPWDPNGNGGNRGKFIVTEAWKDAIRSLRTAAVAANMTPPTSVFTDDKLDPSRCPGCKAPVLEEYSTLPQVPCQNCGRWELETGLLVQAIAGPPGTPPQIARVFSPFWKPVLPLPSNRVHSHKVVRQLSRNFLVALRIAALAVRW